jgi:hypothetical protein
LYALEGDKDMFRDFHDIFPEKLLTRKMKKLLSEYNLR